METKEELVKRIKKYYADYFRLNIIYEQWCNKFGITDYMLFILECLYTYEGVCTQKYLTEYLGYSKQTISASLNRLEKEGIIIRNKGFHDAREKIITFTKKGKKWTKKIIGEMRDIEISAFSSMSYEEREAVTNGFHLLVSRLDDNFNK